jgi:hypothetical protein
MNRNALLVVTAVLTACGGGGGLGQDERAVQARWDDNVAARVAHPLQAAIEQCTKANQGVLAGACDSVAILAKNGFLRSYGYVSVGPPTLADVTVTASTAAIVLVGTDNCVVTITPTVSPSGVIWNYNYTNSGGCDRLKTGVGT